ncbi:hypothetical protein PQO01_08995 [Lentisphaera marina]|uniref:hypothetical protein n=1 Tax=Lentisphaera marina TaxID=1111041 RepID=UPI0023664791|nr:hypothetical protein [Lentisphaera marina]MDD7985083.1 hypothetical protein [Lentisphaera marina]
MNKDLKDLLKVCYGDVEEFDESRVEQLQQRLEEDADFRQELADELYFNGLVQEVQTKTPRWLKIDKILESEEEGNRLESSVMNDITSYDRKSSLRRRFQLISTLAAGLCVGFMGTSAAYGKNIFVSLKQQTMSFFESFEQDIDYYDHGVPIEAKQWGGDTALVVQAENGVSPLHGKSMLKMISSTFEGELTAGNPSNSNVFYMLDLKKYHLDPSKTYICKGSANFTNASDQVTHYGIQILSLPVDAEMPHKQISAQWLMDQSLTFAQNRLPFKERGAWENIETETVLPAESRYLILLVYVLDAEKSVVGPSKFEKHYLDKVSIKISPVE